MSTRMRFGATTVPRVSAPRRQRGPSARTLIVIAIGIFLFLSITIMIAGQLPVTSRPVPATGLTYREYKATEDQILNNYGWVNRQEGVVRIPVSEAVRLINERGLPTRPQAEGQQQP